MAESKDQKQMSIPNGDTMIGEAPRDKAIRRKPAKPAIPREVLQIKSVAAIRQLHGGAVVNVDGIERIVEGKKVSILIEG